LPARTCRPRPARTLHQRTSCTSARLVWSLMTFQAW
jgi:hypothetical protein